MLWGASRRAGACGGEQAGRQAAAGTACCQRHTAPHMITAKPRKRKTAGGPRACLGHGLVAPASAQQQVPFGLLAVANHSCRFTQAATAHAPLQHAAKRIPDRF